MYAVVDIAGQQIKVKKDEQLLTPKLSGEPGDVMEFDQVLLVADDENQRFDPRLQRFLDGILDQRLVDDRQHFLGDRLGGRQEPRAHAGNRKHRLADRFAFSHL